MIEYCNPFEYEAANKFTSDEQILDFYIPDFNYSRFIRSRRNIILVGERGTGKSMTLLYNSLPIQQTEARREEKAINFDIVCIYVPCNTPLTHKREFQLMDEFLGKVISEHFLVTAMMYEIVYTLGKIDELQDGIDANDLKQELQYAMDIKISGKLPFFEALKAAFQKESITAQKAINAKKADVYYNNSISFSTGVVPLLTYLRKIPKLRNSHFSLMIDDAHDLNNHQIRTLNSWIAYRDNTLFSFKVAMAKADRHEFRTESGGTILEGHDYTVVDLERPYQSEESEFGKFARGVVSRRLQKIDPKISLEKFFPVNPNFVRDLQECRKEVTEQAHTKYPNGSKKQIADYIYKYTRAEYYRRRSKRANLPPYSGFDMLVHLSTGVIRNLLEPCYWMYDRFYSDKHAGSTDTVNIRQIPHTVQHHIILERSKRKWDWMREGIASNIEGCSREQAKQIYQLFDNLAILFRERLSHPISEPRAIAFTISETEFEYYEDLLELLRLARKAQLLYAHSSSAKDYGKREQYYVPNRMLWPVRGLDPHGQHARVSLRASHLWAAAKDNIPIPFNLTDKEEKVGAAQGRLRI